MYFLVLLDDRSRFGRTYLLKHKSEAANYIREFCAELERQRGRAVKVLRSDRGGEFISRSMDKWLKEKGIMQQFSCPGTPQQNGDAERRIATLMATVRTTLAWSQVPGHWWGEALLAATDCRNYLTTTALPGDTTPYEVWTGSQPNLEGIRTFGCQAIVHIQKEDRSSKVAPTAVQCIHLRSLPESKGWLFYNPNTKKTLISRDAVFLEDIPGGDLPGMGKDQSSFDI